MKLVYSNNIFNITLVDTSGQPDYSRLTQGAIGNSDCTIVCYSPYVPRSFERVKEAVKDVRTIAEDMPIKSKISAFHETSAMSGNSYKDVIESCIKYTTKSSLWKKKQR
ncbi:GTP-binding protein RHO1 [Entamoeba marina]